MSRVTLAKERRNVVPFDLEKNANLLLKRQNGAIKMHNGLGVGNKDDDDDSNGSHEDSAVLLGASVPVKNTVRAIKLPEVKRLPPYTTWIFLDRCVHWLIIWMLLYFNIKLRYVHFGFVAVLVRLAILPGFFISLEYPCGILYTRTCVQDLGTLFWTINIVINHNLAELDTRDTYRYEFPSPRNEDSKIS